MSNWLTEAIWIILILWSIVEIVGLHGVINNPRARYTRTSKTVTYLWIVFIVSWFCFQFIG